MIFSLFFSHISVYFKYHTGMQESGFVCKFLIILLMWILCALAFGCAVGVADVCVNPGISNNTKGIIDSRAPKYGKCVDQFAKNYFFCTPFKNCTDSYVYITFFFISSFL